MLGQEPEPGDREMLRDEMVSLFLHQRGGAMVVQIDSPDVEEVSGQWNGRLRVMLNEACLYDGKPGEDEVPGQFFEVRDPTAIHVPEDVALDVWSFFEERHDPGMFATRLIQLILTADNENTERLAWAFGAWTRAVHLWKSDKGELRRLAGLES